MDCCGLSSTGLNNIDANEITSNNITIFSNLNVSGYSFFNDILVENDSTFLTLSNGLWESFSYNALAKQKSLKK